MTLSLDHETCTTHAQQRKGDVMGCELTKPLFFFQPWRVIRRVWRSSRRLDTMWSHSFVPFFFSLTTSAMPGPRCRKTNDRISLEVYKNLSIKRICSALPRGNLAEVGWWGEGWEWGEALKRISQCHLVVGWVQGKPCLRWKGWRLLEISQLHACLGKHHLFLWVSIRVSFLERGQVGLHKASWLGLIAAGRYLFG